MPAPTGYSRLQIRLHWIIFGLIALQFVFHEWISEAWDVIEDGGTPAFHPLVAAHVFGGLLVLLLALWRLQVRMSRGAPPPPEAEAEPLKLLAKIVHWALYAVMILMPIGGAVAWFGGVDVAAEGHEVMKAVLLGLVALHVVGALYHQFILRTNLMNRMRQPDP